MSNSWWIAYIWHLWWRWVSTSATKRFSAPQRWGVGMGPWLPGRASFPGGTSITGWWWLEPWNFMTFPYIGHVIIPTDELIFFGGVAQPPTSLIWTEGYQGELTNSHDRPWWTFWPSIFQCFGARAFWHSDCTATAPFELWVQTQDPKETDWWFGLSTDCKRTSVNRGGLVAWGVWRKG